MLFRSGVFQRIAQRGLHLPGRGGHIHLRVPYPNRRGLHVPKQRGLPVVYHHRVRGLGFILLGRGLGEVLGQVLLRSTLGGIGLYCGPLFLDSNTLDSRCGGLRLLNGLGLLLDLRRCV